MNNATEYAKKQADTFRETLSYLVDKQNEQTQAKEQLAKTNYENLVNQINSAKANLEQTYEENARQAYVNKLLGAQEIGAGISRMGLSDSGFRATQDVLNNNQYSANLNQLALNRATGLQDIGDQLVSAQSSYNANLLDIQADANDRLTSLNQYIENQVADKYNNAYSQYMNYLNYQNELSQQYYENSLKERELALLYGTTTGTDTTNGTTTGTGTTTASNGEGTSGGSFGGGGGGGRLSENTTNSTNSVNGHELMEYPDVTVGSVFGTGMALAKDYLGIDATISSKDKIYQTDENKFYVLVKDSYGNKVPIDITDQVTIGKKITGTGFSGNPIYKKTIVAKENKQGNSITASENDRILSELKARKQTKDATSIKR